MDVLSANAGMQKCSESALWLDNCLYIYNIYIIEVVRHFMRRYLPYKVVTKLNYQYYHY